jgi:hypothetical protein
MLRRVALVRTDISEERSASFIRVTKVGLRHVAGNVVLIVRFEVFTVVTVKNGVFWDVTPRGSCKNRRF